MLWRSSAEQWANPSGTHSAARRARCLLDEARESLATTLGAEAGEVVFTSGGTEADNLAVSGVHRRRGGRVLASAIEHHAVLGPAQAAGASLIAVDRDGLLDLDHLSMLLDPSVSLVSVMLVNNEIGVVQDLDLIASVVRARAPDALIHTDAVQAFPWLDVAALARSADLVSISAHKFGGPRGVGALVVRRRARAGLEPLALGGGQEGELRPGTENLPGILAMTAAATATVTERTDVVGRVGSYRDCLGEALRETVPGCFETGHLKHRVAGICHLGFEAVEAEELLFLLDEEGIAASAGSACASGAIEPSHVLLAMGLGRESARSCVRFSLGHATTTEEVEHVIGTLPGLVARLRR